jgi:hypothetical protein
MSAQTLEALLARLYTDTGARRDFLADPRGAAVSAGLEPAEIDALAVIDRVGLELAARSFEKKRAAQVPRRSAWSHRLVALGRYVSLALPSLRARSRRAWRRSRA